MKPKTIFTVAATLICCALLSLSCRENRRATRLQAGKGDSLIFAAGQRQDYQRVLDLADSLQATGDISDMSANRWHGVAYYHQGKMRSAEFYYKKVVEADIKNKEDELNYNKSARRLAMLLVMKGEYEDALNIALAAVERMRKSDSSTDTDIAMLESTIACCQLNLGRMEEADKSFEKSYELFQEIIQNSSTGREMQHAFDAANSIAIEYLNARHYDGALVWVERAKAVVDEYASWPSSDKKIVGTRYAQVNMYQAVVLQNLGRDKEAAKCYREAHKSDYAKSAEGRIYANKYLVAAHRYAEAAENFRNLDRLLEESGIQLSLENIQQYLLPKFRANVEAQRRDSAIAVGMKLCDALDSAIVSAKHDDAAELATIYGTQEKEAQIARQQDEMTQQRLIYTAAALILVILFFSIYILHKRNATHRLAAAHEELKKAYDQLEETTALKERMESEVRIAHDIQMSMVPSLFPDRKGLDLYAYVSPAKGVGGDLYGYLLQGDTLYFCLGDVSGKGIPASLFMAQATRLFRTLAAQGMMPADICTQLNNALSEDNEQGMFVTLFIGLVDLKTGHLNFCNAGHNPPVLSDKLTTHHSSLITYHFLDMLPNAPIGLWPGLEYEGEEIDSIKGRVFFVYSDGLNEAENREQEQFGDDHLLELLAHNDFVSAKQTIEMMKEEVEKHRDGADPNDDLTMLCLWLDDSDSNRE